MFPLVLTVLLAGQPAVPVFPVGLVYDVEDPAAWRSNLPPLRAAGFTFVVVPPDRVEAIRPIARQAEMVAIPSTDQETLPYVRLNAPGASHEPIRYLGWNAIRSGARAILFDPETPEQLRAAAAFAGVVTANSKLFLSIKRIDGARTDDSGIDVQLFQSGEALVVLALNRGDRARTATIFLPQGSPLAEWVNLETGGVAYFDRAPDAVTHRHKFGPNDALVLVIRRDIQ